MNAKISSFAEQWQFHTFEGQAILLNPTLPDWAVPGQEAARLLAHPSTDATLALARASLEQQLSGSSLQPYRGRGTKLSLGRLKECWFHLTNKCNLACRHCLFSCSPASSTSLAPDLLARGLRESRQLGCTLFYFTGGEPFLYPGFTSVLQELLAEPDNHVVVLTNGLLLAENLQSLAALPSQRLHLQISLDGLEPQHDDLRGRGTYQRLLKVLALLRGHGFRVTLSMAVNRVNLSDLPGLVEVAAAQGVTNLHFLWHFVRGEGKPDQFAAPSEIFPQLVRAQEVAESCGVIIDNVETIRSQVFSSPGTRFDLSNTGWESVAIGPDGHIYPSPALVLLPELDCGRLEDGLQRAWQQSPVLEKIRSASLIDSPELARRPMSMLIGGGDLDHSYMRTGEFVGHDPYLELYENLSLWLISRQAARYPVRNPAEIILRMGDVRHDCPDGGQAVSLTHCNCVISLADGSGHRSVREFYGQAALQTNAEIVNPFAPARDSLKFIPLKSRQRTYGCGSPVVDAAPAPGEVLVDLGSGSGCECFLAARQVGRAGKVYGIDMTPEMLELARESKAEVIAKLGYDNLEFRQGYLEAIPLPDDQADVVISNCVINLSPDKRATFHEIYRVLKPGGRVVVSDITADQPIPLAIKNNRKFRGECLGGALQQEQLLAMLRSAGFTAVCLLKRFPYREVGGTRFYSLTFSCQKPAGDPGSMEVIYRGPLAAVMTEEGQVIFKGRPVRLENDPGQLSDDFFHLDAKGAVTNQEGNASCGCGPANPTPAVSQECCTPEAAASPLPLPIIPATGGNPGPSPVTLKRKRDCLVCGKPLTYAPLPRPASCHYCGKSGQTEISCPDHYVCDRCHLSDGLAIIRQICTTTGERDLLALLHLIRSHAALPLHGPEHHVLVPGIILASWRNCGGEVDENDLLTAIERSSKIPGGVCGLWGGCGAGLGAGIAFAVILEASPLTATPRQEAQRVTARLMNRLAADRAPRCCRRESMTALLEASAIARENFGMELPAQYHESCLQTGLNRECIGKACPYLE